MVQQEQHPGFGPGRMPLAAVDLQDAMEALRHAIARAQTIVDAHAAAADPHAGYQQESEKGVANGYAGLNGSGLVPTSQLPATMSPSAHASAHAEAGSDRLTSITVDNTGLRVRDTGGDHELVIKPSENLSADRTLSVSVNNGDRTLTVQASTTLNGGTHSGTNTGDQSLASLGAASSSLTNTTPDGLGQPGNVKDDDLFLIWRDGEPLAVTGVELKTYVSAP